MKPYDRTELCPKCGGLLSKRIYHAEVSARDASYKPERLQAICADCGYSVDRAPKDKDPVTPYRPEPR